MPHTYFRPTSAIPPGTGFGGVCGILCTVRAGLSRIKLAADDTGSRRTAYRITVKDPFSDLIMVLGVFSTRKAARRAYREYIESRRVPKEFYKVQRFTSRGSYTYFRPFIKLYTPGPSHGRVRYAEVPLFKSEEDAYTYMYQYATGVLSEVKQRS